MRWPFEHYAKALLVSMPPAEALDRLIDTGHLQYVEPEPGRPHPAYNGLAALKRRLTASRPSGCVPGSVTEEMWLRVNKIAGYCLGEVPVVEALDLLSRPKVRYALDVLLIGGLPTSTISEQLDKVYRVQISPLVLDHYAHYFWDRDTMGPNDWRAYLVTEVVAGGRTTLVDAHPNGRVLLQVLHSDPGVALWRAGIITAFDAESALNILLNWGITRFSETAIEANTPGGAIKMERYAKIVLEALDRRTSLGGAIQEQVKRAYQLTTELRKLSIGDARELLTSQQTAADFMAKHTERTRKMVQR